MGVPISNVTRRVVYAASGTGPYNFTFEILAAGDIAVYQDDTLLTLTTNYTVTINSNGTGFVTLTAAPTGATQIAIVGNRTISRTTDFVTGGDFFANTLNDELDQQTIFSQQNAEGLQRALSAPQTDPISINMALPRASLRANRLLSFDASGNPSVQTFITDPSNNVAITGGTINGTSIGATTPSTGAFSSLGVASGSLSSPSIFRTGDTNTGVFFPAADNIAFVEGGVEVMRINSSSNVGIGTTSAATKLEVAGNNNTAWSVTASITGATMDVTAVSSGTIDVGDLVFASGVAPYTRVTAFVTGSGGIGTYTVSVFQTVSSATLTGATSYGNTIIRITDADTSAAAGQPTGALQFFTSDASTPTAGVGAYVASISESTTPDSALVFGTRDNAGGGVDANERMRISSNGNVGINTTSPTELFSIRKDQATGTSILVENGLTNSNAYSSISAGSDVGNIVLNANASLASTSELIGGGSGASLYTTSGFSNGLSVGTFAGPLKFFAGSSTAERMRINSAGQIGFNSTSLGGGSGLYRFAGNITGNAASAGALYSPSVQSDVTSQANIVATLPSTQDTAFSLTDLRHFFANQGTITGGSRTAPTNQYGFYANGTITGATNNYGFYSNINAATNRWNFYANGTAQNYFAGNVGIGTTSPTAPLTVSSTAATVDVVRLYSDIDGAVQSETGIGFNPGTGTVQPAARISALELDASDSRASLLFYTRDSNSDVAATERIRITHDGLVGIGTSTPSQELHIYRDSNTSTQIYVENPNVGSTADSRLTLTNDLGTAAVFVAGSSTYSGSEITGGALGAGLYTASALTNGLSVGTSAGPLRFFAGSTSAERMRIDSSGNVRVTGSGGLGYGTGSGGTVTQGTNKSTAVTLNKATGQITMNAAALAAGASVIFTLTNSLIAATDTLLANHSATGGTTSGYAIQCLTCASGSATIRVTNITGGSLSEGLIINFTILKGATS